MVRKPGSEIWVSFNPTTADAPTHQRFIINTPRTLLVKVGWQDNPWRSRELDDDREHALLCGDWGRTWTPPGPTPNNSLARRPAGIWRHPRRPRTGSATRMPPWQAMQRSRSAPSGLAAKAFDGGGYRGVVRLRRSPFRPKIARRAVWWNFGSIKFDPRGQEHGVSQ